MNVHEARQNLMQAIELWGQNAKHWEGVVRGINEFEEAVRDADWRIAMSEIRRERVR